jgi:hypothetical protein
MANLDEGTMWPTYYALTKLTAANEKRISAVVKKAVSWRLTKPPGIAFSPLHPAGRPA